MNSDLHSANSKLGIRPGVSILGVLRHLNYQPWFALAEFVDNSLQSYLANRSTVLNAQEFVDVRVKIDTSGQGRISIRDDAAGIAMDDFPRAFRPAQLPPDRSGLSEFGMGMKSAACWFANNWTVRTTCVGDPIERTVMFDIERIVNDDLDEIEISERPISAASHFTVIELRNLHHRPVKRTLGKIKSHLASIYRQQLRSQNLRISVNDEILEYSDPSILVAPHYQDQEGPKVLWRRDFNLAVSEQVNLNGFAAIREVGSTTQAGFSLFRRNRLIQGSDDEKYRPVEIFGHPNSYAFQRIFGEINLEGLQVSHTKDGFQWQDYEPMVLQHLKSELDQEPTPLLRMAENYRSRPKKDQVAKSAAAAVDSTASALESFLAPTLEKQIWEKPTELGPTAHLEPQDDSIALRQISVVVDGARWQIELELSSDPSQTDWVELGDSGSPEDDPRILKVQLSLAHPFMVEFASPDHGELEPLLRLAAAIGLAEITARQSGAKHAGELRRRINELLRGPLSQRRS